MASDAARDAVTPERVLETALHIVESEGLDALSMRRLAAALGVRTPSVYWHVGNRQELLARLVERITEDFGRIRPVGRTPIQRISSVCLAVLAEVRRRPYVIAVSRTAGRGEAIFTPAQQVLAREVLAAGLSGREAAFALRTILFQLGGFLLVDHGVANDSSLHGVDRWEVADPDLRAELQTSADLDDIFRYSLEAVLARLLP